MKELLLFVGLSALLAVTLVKTAHAYNEPSHWKDNSVYQIDKYQDKGATCYVAYDHRNSGYPPPSISCVNN